VSTAEIPTAVGRLNLTNKPETRCVRGVFLEYVRQWLIEHKGQEYYNRFKNSLPEKQADLLDKAERAEWYPSENSLAIQQRLVDTLGTEVVENMAREMIRKSISGFLKGLASFASPAMLAKRAPAFWEKTYSSGRLKTDKVGPKEFTVTVYDWKGTRFGCRIIGIWIEEMILLTGVKKYSIKKVNCVFDGDDYCQWRVSYE
jgi:hypothetical protein